MLGVRQAVRSWSGSDGVRRLSQPPGVDDRCYSLPVRPMACEAGFDVRTDRMARIVVGDGVLVTVRGDNAEVSAPLLACARLSRLAVMNGLTLPWNSGAVEGHVNRVKMLKRQMYGRAKFDLLRRRILQPN